MSAAPSIAAIKNALLRVGYDASYFHDNLPLTNGSTVPVVAFAGHPFDARTSCISAATGNGHNETLATALRSAAAPISIITTAEHYEVWRHNEAGAHQLDRIESKQLENYIDRNRRDLAPSAIYRAKIWGRFESHQLEFVDAGLLPLIESEAGDRITALIVDLVGDVQRALGWRTPTEEQGKWLLKAVFWLLAAKILRDKRVERFIRLELKDIDSVFDRVAQHYRAPTAATERPLGRERRAALEQAAGRIESFTNLRLLSTESLGYVYESALIDKATRQKLGTHSTPAWLVDYLIGRLRPHIEAMPVSERRVFEPACGHAGFLIGGLRLLSELRPLNYQEDRKTYLRKRLRGVEIDLFAVEIARLSLTLADVPNPNGWALETADMFEGETLAEEAEAATIVLSNPPFERFSADEREDDWQHNKASETLRRVAEHLPKGGVLGFILPQNFLVSEQDASLRKLLSTQFEVSEISVFADRVFRCGAPESAILIAQRVRTADDHRVLYQRIREAEIKDFKLTYQASSAEQVPQSVLREDDSALFLVPELMSVWIEKRHLDRLADHVTIGKGFEHNGVDSLPKGATTESRTRRAGFVRGFARWSEDVALHGLPQEAWLNVDESVIRRPLYGVATGEPQVLVNHARVNRGPWCLKALIDPSGHAVKGRFLVVRPRDATFSLPVLWALINSPIGNAFMHAHSGKRDMLGKTLEAMPVPTITDEARASLEQAVQEYFAAARSYAPAPGPQTRLFEPHSSAASPVTRDDLRNLMWTIDAQVLALYNLRPESEQQVLHLFTGFIRSGVQFEQNEYLPKGYHHLSRLSDLLRIVTSWDAISEKKEQLVDKKLQRKANEAELRELQDLQRLTSARRELLAPLPIAALEQVKADLVRKGLWKD